jgi:hypothetical protein
MIAGASTHFGSDGHVTMTHQRTGRKNERHVARFAARGGPLINSIDQHPVQVPLIYLVEVDHQVQHMSNNVLRYPPSRSRVIPEIKNPIVFLATGEFDFSGLFLYRREGPKTNHFVSHARPV